MLEWETGGGRVLALRIQRTSLTIRYKKNGRRKLCWNGEKRKNLNEGAASAQEELRDEGERQKKTLIYTRWNP